MGAHAVDRVQRESTAEMVRTFQVRAELGSLLTLLVDAETGARGYLLTRDHTFLEPYYHAIDQLPVQYLQLGKLVRHPEQRERLERVRLLMERRVAAMKQVVAGASQSSVVTLRDRELLVEGKLLMDEVRAQMAPMQAAQDAVLEGTTAAIREAQALSLLVVSVGAGLGMVGGIVAMLLFTAGVARRLEQVTANADRLAEHQPLIKMAAGDDEIGQLGRRLEKAADLLAAHDQARARAEADLRKSAREIQDLYDHAPCGYHSLDVEGRFVAINQTELDWLGYTRSEVVGRLAFKDVVTPASQERFAQAFGVVLQTGGVRDVEFELQTRSGRVIPVSISSTAIRGEAGEFLASRASLFDITERQRAEHDIRRLNGELQEQIQAQQLLNRELEAFSYTVSHDLRAPLRHITGFSALLERKAGTQLDAEGRRLVSRMSLAASRMGRLIDDLLVFSRMGRTEILPRPVDLSTLIEEVRQEVDSDAEGRDIHWAIHSLPAVAGDRAMLKLAFVNLLANAVKYTGTRARPEIEIGTEADGNGRTVIYVRDNGIGFDMTYADKLFGVFQRLHNSSAFEGTGIGLATVRRIVERHRGLTWANSIPEEGATFFVALPTHVKEAVA